ncbi:uncharacterized protein LOC135811625 isoform X2 [Sycon ciliatum]|uniref:uncharacterized protein LOC135811625 isoform X2 n=1 Tax=Sycon ciliatum TaxID=27933 RepID=UPI0031F6A195
MSPKKLAAAECMLMMLTLFTSFHSTLNLVQDRPRCAAIGRIKATFVADRGDGVLRYASWTGFNATSRIRLEAGRSLYARFDFPAECNITVTEITVSSPGSCNYSLYALEDNENGFDRVYPVVHTRERVTVSANDVSGVADVHTFDLLRFSLSSLLAFQLNVAVSSTSNYSCDIPVTYRGEPYISVLSQDIDECSMARNPCSSPSTASVDHIEQCRNTYGSFTCNCSNGYASGGKTCIGEPAISRNPMPTSETRVGRVGTSSRVTAVTSSTPQHESHAESSSSRTPELSNTRTLHQTPEDSTPSTSSHRTGDGHDHMRTEATPIPSHGGTSLEDEGQSSVLTTAISKSTSGVGSQGNPSITRTLRQTTEIRKPSNTMITASSNRIGDGHAKIRTDATPRPPHPNTSLEDEGQTSVVTTAVLKAASSTSVGSQEPYIPSSTLGDTAVAGIAIGTVIALALIGLLILQIMRMRKPYSNSSPLRNRSAVRTDGRGITVPSAHGANTAAHLSFISMSASTARQSNVYTETEMELSHLNRSPSPRYYEECLAVSLPSHYDVPKAACAVAHCSDSIVDVQARYSRVSHYDVPKASQQLESPGSTLPGNTYSVPKTISDSSLCPGPNDV